MSNSTGGPYVQMALLCERVLQEKDNVLSVIRAIDRFTITAAGQNPPAEMPPGAINAMLVVTLKSGDMRGRFNIRVVPRSPSLKTMPEIAAGVLLEGGDRGVNFLAEVHMAVTEEGLYWFDVYLEDQLLTRIPMRVLYQRVAQGGLFQRQ